MESSSALPRVYVETSVISYLTAWRSPQLIMAANQQATREWWDTTAGRFDLFVSQAVVLEAAGGDPEAARRRLEVVSNVPRLDISAEVTKLSERVLERTMLPPRARMDAVHIAAAAVHGMEYLVSWNCRHIANARLRRSLELAVESGGFTLPTICTPLELMPDDWKGFESDG